MIGTSVATDRAARSRPQGTATWAGVTPVSRAMARTVSTTAVFWPVLSVEGCRVGAAEGGERQPTVGWSAADRLCLTYLLVSSARISGSPASMPSRAWAATSATATF